MSESLPKGKRCYDCDYWNKCNWLVSAQPDWESCDFSPSRFRPSIMSKLDDYAKIAKDQAAEIERLKAIIVQLVEAAEKYMQGLGEELYYKHIINSQKRLEVFSEYLKIQAAIEAAGRGGRMK